MFKRTALLGFVLLFISACAPQEPQYLLYCDLQGSCVPISYSQVPQAGVVPPPLVRTGAPIVGAGAPVFTQPPIEETRGRPLLRRVNTRAYSTPPVRTLQSPPPPRPVVRFRDKTGSLPQE